MAEKNVAAADSLLSVFDDINPKTLRSSYLNKGYMPVDYSAPIHAVDPITIKFMPKSMVYFDEYFGRFTPKPTM